MNKSEISLLEGTWELTYISGPRIAFAGLYPRQRPTIKFDTSESRIFGHSSCNNYHGEVIIEGNKISFDKMGATLMACEGNGEEVYFKTLKTVNTYSVSQDNNELTFNMDDVALMRFIKK